MVRISKYAMLTLAFMWMFSIMAAAGSSAPTSVAAGTADASSIISTTLCGIVGEIQSVVGIIALALFILGGALYAVAHMLPAAGNLKGNLQGWSLGMIVGGIVGLIIVILAPHLVSTIAAAGSASGGPSTLQNTC